MLGAPAPHDGGWEWGTIRKKMSDSEWGIPRSKICRHLLVRLVMITYLFIVGINVKIGPKDPGNYTKIPRLMT